MVRPSIHFAPEKNWMNDPNGTVFKDGTFHLFYQYNPEGSEWGNIHWAYATSRDLLDWKRRGLKLTPDASIGERYCFSGCTVPMPEGFKCFYTSIGYEDDAVQHHAKQLICDADGGFQHIRRNGHAITDSIHGFPVSEWRDPFVFCFGGKSYMVLAGIAEGKSSVLLYEATDKELNDWKYLAPLFSISAEQDMIECPNVAVFGNKIVLIYSLAKENVVKYVCGEFDGSKIAVGGEGYVDYGVNCFYATNLSEGHGGETILYAWEKESLVGTASPDGKYSGCLAIPRILRLNGYRPEYYFVNSLFSLYKRAFPVERDGAHTKITGFADRTMLAFEVESDGDADILKNSQERVTLSFRGEKLHILRASLCANADERELTADIPKGKKDVQIVSDGTVTEVLVNNTTAVSFRFYNQRPIDCIFECDCAGIGEVQAGELNAAKIE